MTSMPPDGERSAIRGDASGDLAALIRRYVCGATGLGAGELECSGAVCSVRVLAKGASVLSPGEVAAGAALVLRGCLRVSFVECDGAEAVLSFAPEGWWVTDLESVLLDRPSELRITALEPTRTLMIDRRALTGLRHSGSAGDRIAACAIEQTVVSLQRRLLGSMRRSATERYVDFQRLYPGLDRRIPQYEIASYLGISPEFLSKLRKRLARRA